MNAIQSIIITNILKAKIERDEDYTQIIDNVNLDFEYKPSNVVVYDNLECMKTIKNMLESDDICDVKDGIRIMSDICCNDEVINIVYESDLVLILLELIHKDKNDWITIYGLAILLYLSEIDILFLMKYLDGKKIKEICGLLTFQNIIFQYTGSIIELTRSCDDSLHLRVKRLISNEIDDKI
jgi:hypothetical protein